MSARFGRRGVLQAGLAITVGGFFKTARAHEYFTANFTLIHPWTRASAPGATTANICMTFDEVTSSDRLIAASSPLAESAVMGGEGAGRALDIAIAQGIKTELTEAGVHLRLVRLKQPLELAREYAMTLVFARSGTLRATFLVDYPPAS